MEPAGIKHLEMIQAVVSRLAQNSFALKGWSVTLVGAGFALGAREGSSAYILLGLFPTWAFWWLDANCLRQERLYRCLFDLVRKEMANPHHHPDFGMDTSRFASQTPGRFRTLFSQTVLGLYGPMTALILGIAFVIRNR